MRPDDHMQPVGVQPAFVALPARGGDPVCGLSRSWWYGAERAGLIRLARIRAPGNVRAGRVLLPVDRAVSLVQKLSDEIGRNTPDL